MRSASRAEAVGDDDGGAAGGDLHEPLVHRLLLQRVDRRRRFVQQDRVVLAKQPARDRQPLPLSEREVVGAELPRQGPVGRHKSENRRGAGGNW